MLTALRWAIALVLLASGFAFSTKAVYASGIPPVPGSTPTQEPELPPDGLAWSNIPLSLTPPDSAAVDGFVGHKQSLSLSCEARSAADWASFFGVRVGELEFFRALPISTNPDKGFVGNVRGTWGQVPPNAYGVHAGPVARLLQRYGLTAYYHLYTPWSSVQAEVAAGRPVIVWVTGHVEPGAGQHYTAPDGHRTFVAPFEHTVIVVGYDRYSVIIEDEGHRYTRTVAQFLESWQALRNMAITTQP